MTIYQRQTYTAEMVTAQIEGHKADAIRFLELAESNDIHKFQIVVDTLDTYVLIVPVYQPTAGEIARHFFYEMSHYHTKQKIRWEMIQAGADPDGIIVTSPKK